MTIPRVQRRNHYRLPVSIPVTWAPLDGEGPVENVALTMNLSEDGVLMSGFDGEAPPVEAWLILKIPIPGRFPVFVAGQVLRHSEVNEEQKWVVAIKFRGSEQRDRDRIFAYIMREQRKQIRRRREPRS